MKISAQFMPGDLPVFVESVRRAEEAGYARAYLVEGQLLWRDVYVYMAHGLAATDRIPFGTAVTNPRTRHYSVIASAHASLAELYPGRVVLGMGRGDNAVRTLGLKQVSTKQLRETVPKLRALMAGRPVDCDGTEIRIQWANEATGEVPIMISATGSSADRHSSAMWPVISAHAGNSSLRAWRKTRLCCRRRDRFSSVPIQSVPPFNAARYRAASSLARACARLFSSTLPASAMSRPPPTTVPT